MIELPETYVLSEQINGILVGKTIACAVANVHPHAFAAFTGDPATYNERLAGRSITGANPGTVYTCGGYVEIECDDMLLVLGTPIKYHAPEERLPKSHQLLLEFTDGAYMSCTVQMWGSLFCYPAGTDGLPKEGFICNKVPSPYEDSFDEAYFDRLWERVKPTMSAKAFFSTEQRIPGLGNGVLQDILWNAGIHPKRKLGTISDAERGRLYQSLKSTLFAMRDQGGRDTERDLYGCAGGYKTILSNKTLRAPCPACGGSIVRQPYLGGNVYYCPVCQPTAM